jgi:hypothetical protein
VTGSRRTGRPLMQGIAQYRACVAQGQQCQVVVSCGGSAAAWMPAVSAEDAASRNHAGGVLG